MGGIIWLASYPKSGNTWMRAFLANLFLNRAQPVDINDLAKFAFGDARADLYERAAGGKPLAEMDDAALHKLRPRVHRMIAAARAETVFAKTHNMITTLDGIATITPEVTAGAIYIARNPMDVAISYSHHFGITLDETIEAMASEINHVVTIGRNVFQYIGSWSGHAESWMAAPGLTPLVVRYEDMAKRPKWAFGRVVKFLQLPRDPARLAKAIKFSTFKTLAEQEKAHGFVERSQNNERFFRAGRPGGWRNVLSEAQVAKLVADHGAVMKRLGYLGDDGRLRC